MMNSPDRRRLRLILAGVLALVLAVVNLAAQRDPAGVLAHRLDASRLRALPADRSGDEALMRHLGSHMPLDNTGQPWSRLSDEQRPPAITIVFEWRMQFVGLKGYIAEQRADGPYPSLDEVIAAYRTIGCNELAQDLAQGSRALAAGLPAVSAPATDGGQRRKRILAEAAAARKTYIDEHAEAIAGR